MKLHAWMLVALGGAAGSLARYGIMRSWPMLPGGLPLSTMLINVAGSLLIGCCSVLFDPRVGPASDGARLFWMTGVLGGFTTYSTFALEAVLLADGGQALKSASYAVLTVVGCIAAAWLGRTMTSQWL